MGRQKGGHTMNHYKNAVIAFFSLYTFALIQKESSQDTSNYDYIIYKVTDYLEQLELYEIEILKMRYIDACSLENIATTLGYKSHSSVSNIINKIITTLAVYEKQLAYEG